MANFTELFYAMLPFLHAVGAILALSISFACDTGRAIQTARIPYRLPLPTVNFSYSQDRAFLAAYPWDEGGEFITHQWNPFALIFVFEWITAGFALRPLMYFMQNKALLMQIWLVWLTAGVVVFLAWSLTNTGGVCVAMLCTVLASFTFSMLVAYLTIADSIGGEVDEPANAKARFSSRTGKYTRMEKQKQGGAYEVLQGRVWWVPQSVHALRHRAPERGLAHLSNNDQQSNLGLTADDVDFENTEGVLIRYTEYCITAPLLFLSVVCLMVVDAPAWLFLTGYWLLITCNAVGCALHACFAVHVDDHSIRDSGGWVGFVIRLFFANPWSDPGANQGCLLQAAWVCLLVPMTGLIFLTKDILLATDMPALVLVLIWNLLLTYSLFGIVPTLVYITGLGRKRLAWLLDILNLLAKFPLPLIILSGFITRPATNKFCFNQ